MKDMDTSVMLMNSDIEAVSDWAYRHGLQLNENKTQVILIANPRVLSNIPFDIPKLKLNDCELEYRDKIKNLGLVINTTLTWNEQVTAVCNKVFASIHSIKRVSTYLPLPVKIMLNE